MLNVIKGAIIARDTVAVARWLPLRGCISPQVTCVLCVPQPPFRCPASCSASLPPSSTWMSDQIVRSTLPLCWPWRALVLWRLLVAPPPCARLKSIVSECFVPRLPGRAGPGTRARSRTQIWGGELHSAAFTMLGI